MTINMWSWDMVFSANKVYIYCKWSIYESIYFFLMFFIEIRSFQKLESLCATECCLRVLEENFSPVEFQKFPETFKICLKDISKIKDIFKLLKYHPEFNHDRWCICPENSLLKTGGLFWSYFSICAKPGFVDSHRFPSTANRVPLSKL